MVKERDHHGLSKVLFSILRRMIVTVNLMTRCGVAGIIPHFPAMSDAFLKHLDKKSLISMCIFSISPMTTFFLEYAWMISLVLL